MDKKRDNSSLYLKDEQYTNGFTNNGVVLNAKHLDLPFLVSCVELLVACWSLLEQVVLRF